MGIADDLGHHRRKPAVFGRGDDAPPERHAQNIVGFVDFPLPISPLANI